MLTPNYRGTLYRGGGGDRRGGVESACWWSADHLNNMGGCATMAGRHKREHGKHQGMGRQKGKQKDKDNIGLMMSVKCLDKLKREAKL